MYYPTTFLQTTAARGLAATLLSVGLWASAGLAHADNIGVTTQDVVAQGGVANVIFDFDFSSGPVISSLDVHLNYDASLVTLMQNTVTYQGQVIDPASLFAPGDYSTNFDPSTGSFSAVFLPFSNPNAVVSLSGTASWTLSYALKPGFNAPGGTPVQLDFSYSDALGDTGIVNGALPTNPPTLVASVITAAVPEPETWAMLFAGLSLVVLFARRRVVQRQA